VTIGFSSLIIAAAPPPYSPSPSLSGDGDAYISTPIKNSPLKSEISLMIFIKSNKNIRINEITREKYIGYF